MCSRDKGKIASNQLGSAEKILPIDATIGGRRIEKDYCSLLWLKFVSLVSLVSLVPLVPLVPLVSFVSAVTYVAGLIFFQKRR